MRKSYILTAVVIFILSSKSQEQTNLLNLKSNWTGNGNAVLYPGAMKLLSVKSQQQAGILSTITQLPASSDWKLELSFRRISEADLTDIGVGFWLTRNNPSISPLDYKFDLVNSTFGMAPAIDGLGLVYVKNTLYSSLSKSERTTRTDLVYKSKACKLQAKDNESIKLIIKYRNKVLSIYFAEDKTTDESLCVQYTEIDGYDNFYLSASASSDFGKCSVEVDSIIITQPKSSFQFIDEKDKKAGDPFFAYFSDMSKTNSHRKLNDYNNLFLLQSENSKILARELLEFADVNQKDMKEKMSKEIKGQVGRIEEAVKVIGMEAQQLESLSSIIDQENKQATSNMADILDLVLEWLGQMNDAYSSVDAQTKKIHDMLSEIDVKGKLLSLNKKSDDIAETMQSFLFKTRDFTEDNFIRKIRSKDLVSWDAQLKAVKSRLTKSLKAKTDIGTSSFRILAYEFLAVVAGLIIIVYLYMYFKIQKAARHKRIH